MTQVGQYTVGPYSFERDTVMRYRKIRFYSKRHGATAGLVIQHDGKTFHSIEELSRLFPVSEALKMKRLQVSPIFATWNDAFEFEFPTA